MIVEPLNPFAGSMLMFSVIVCAIIGIIGGTLLFKDNKKKKVAAIVLFIAMILISFTIADSLQQVPKGHIGLDDNGNWYLQGYHFILKPTEVTMVNLEGSVPLWEKGLYLKYNLTQEQVILLARGSHFPERLRNMYAYSIDEKNWKVEMYATSDVPEEFKKNPPDVRIMIEPSFFIYRTILPSQIRNNLNRRNSN